MVGFLLYTVTFDFLIHLNKEILHLKCRLFHYCIILHASKIFEFLNSKILVVITRGGLLLVRPVNFLQLVWVMPNPFNAQFLEFLGCEF